MIQTPPKTFLGKPPTPQHEAVLKEKETKEEVELREKERAEKEAEIQPVIEKEIEEVIAPPKPMEWWIHQILFWGMALYIVVTTLVIPFATNLKYSTIYGKENAFSKAHPDLITALITRKENMDKETDCNLKKALDPFYKCE